MNKKLILIIIMFILSLPLVFTLYGGETWNYNFPECDKLKVNITAIDTIDKGEYIILNNCENTSNNYYICDCENNYNFSVKFHSGAVNNYTLIFNYAYSKYKEDSDNNRGSSSKKGSFTSLLKVNSSIIKSLRINITSRFNIDGIQHTLKIIEIGDNYVVVEIQSKVRKLNLTLNKEQKIDFEDDNYYDLKVILKKVSGKIARIELKHIKEYYKKEKNNNKNKIINKETTIEENNKSISTDEIKTNIKDKTKNHFIYWLIGAILTVLFFLGIIIYFIFFFK